MQVDEGVQAGTGDDQPSHKSNAASGSATPASEAAEDAAEGPETAPAGASVNATEQGYTDTIQSLLSELWKERLVSLLTACCAHLILRVSLLGGMSKAYKRH